MKAYFVTMLVVDHDELGAEGIKGEIEANNWANDCIHPRMVDAVEVDIGEWEDSHPLNYANADLEPYLPVWATYAEWGLGGEEDGERLSTGAIKLVKGAPFIPCGEHPSSFELTNVGLSLEEARDKYKEDR